MRTAASLLAIVLCTSASGLDVFPNSLCHPGDDAVQCSSLCDLFFATGNVLKGWATGQSFCNWPGVTCVAGQVTALDLSGMGLFGHIPDSIANLTSLVRLDLSNQGMPIGTSGIPSTIGMMSNLEYLDLSSNDFVGTIPVSFWNLLKLRVLKLSHTQLTGSIPDLAGIMSKLEVMDLSFCRLTGTIPDVLGKLSGLRSLNFEGNQLTGPIPDSLSQLSGLQLLRLSGNSISWTSHGICNLVYFGSLSNCAITTITGLTPACASACDGTWTKPPNGLCQPGDDAVQCSSLCDLYFATNHAIQDWANGQPVCYWAGVTCVGGKVIALDLSGQGLSGYIPESIGELLSLSRLDLSNQTYGNSSLPTPFGSFGFPDSMAKLSNLNYLDLSFNDFLGSIPNWISRLSELQFLSFSNNNPLGGIIPESIGQLSKLQVLKMSHTQLTGTIPESLGSLQNLQTLDLAHCMLNGTIPASLGQISGLRSLNLTGNNLQSWTSHAICDLIYEGKLSDCQIVANPLACPLPACAPACGATCSSFFSSPLDLV